MKKELNIPNRSVPDLSSTTEGEHVIKEINVTEKMTKIKQCIVKQTNMEEVQPKNYGNLVAEMMTHPNCNRNVNVTGTKEANKTKCTERKRVPRNSRDRLQFNTENCHANGQEKIAKQVRCNDCNYVTPHRYLLMRHTKAIHLNVKDHKCKDCNYCTYSKSRLKQHIKSVHLRIKDLKCTMCNYSTSDKSHLIRHAKLVHGSSSTLTSSKQVKATQVRCKDCNYVTSRKNHLMQHTNAIHLNIKDIKCKDCNYCTSFTSCLNRHIKAVHKN